MKATLTIGQIGDKFEILKDASVESVPHFEYLRQLTLDGGVIATGKTKKRMGEVIVLHTAKGVMKRRKF